MILVAFEFPNHDEWDMSNWDVTTPSSSSMRQLL